MNQNSSRKIKTASEITPLQSVQTFSTRYLISKHIDLLMIGGGSLILLILMNVMLTGSNPDSKIGWWVYSLSFVANFPHFLASYQILYSDHSDKLLTDKKFIWAGFIAPAIIIGFLAYGVVQGDAKTWGYLVSAMYFFVGWHYVKQIFGGITVSNAINGFFYNSIERWALKTNLFSLWAISFLGFNTGSQSYLQDGIPYASLNLPIGLTNAAYWLLSLSAMALIILNVNKYIREGKAASPAAIVCLLTIYAWYLPLMSHPMFMHTIPFFHSVQYLLFVYVFRRNKVLANTENLNTPDGRVEWLSGIWGYLAMAAVLGAVFMSILPRYLDTLPVLDSKAFGPTAAFFAFTVFINIHHYFIDNVIWRGQNEQMKKYLFTANR